MKRQYVLDAWAVLALLQGEEPAAARVKRLLEEATRGRAKLFISIINLGEVMYRVGKVKGEKAAQETLEQIRRLPLSVVSATDDAVFVAAELKMRYPISYADVFAAATAEKLGAVLVTGDPELDEVGERVRIEKLRRKRH